METFTKVLVGLGVFAAGAATVGVYEHYKGKSAAAANNALIGGSQAASAASGASSSSGTAASGAATVPAVSAAMPAPAAATLIDPGKTYLVSGVLPTGLPSTDTLASLTSAASAVGVTVNQTWPTGQVPANWPSSDVDPTRARASITYNGAVSVPVASLSSFAAQAATTFGIPAATITSALSAATITATGS